MKVLFIAYDNDSYIHYFPLGIAYLATILEKKGAEVYILNQDINHYTEAEIKDFIECHNPNFVCIGSVAGYYPYKKILDISKAVNEANNRKNFKYVIGGHMVSAAPEYFLEKTKADHIVVGEGENAIIDIVYNDCKDSIVRKPRIENLDELPSLNFNLFPMVYYRLQRLPNILNNEFSMSIISGRGCHYKCNFCYRMEEGIRLRSIDKIVEEIKILQRYYKINYIDFADDLTMSSKQRAVELSEALMPLNIKWRCEGRLNYTDPDILSIMKKAGCTFINYGIESLDNTVLKNMHKALTKDMIIKGVEATLEAGISPGLNIIWGNIGDNLETLGESVEFLKKYDDGSQLRSIRFVTPYPGCELFNVAIERGLIKDVADFYENKHINSDLMTVNFTEIDDETCYKALYIANDELLYNYFKNKYSKLRDTTYNLYINKDVNFRGYRQT